MAENVRSVDRILEMHLRQVRNNGWALDDEEYLTGRRCVGAPIFDFTGSAIACVSVSGDTNELADERLGLIKAAVTNTAKAISKRMGYVP